MVITSCRRRWTSALLVTLCILCWCITISFSFTTYTQVQVLQQPNNIIHTYSINNCPLYSSSPNGEDSTSNGRKRKVQRITDKNLYSILGASPTMNRADIKRCYITLAKQTHPDSSNENDVNRFNEIAQAWEILSDDKARRSYDRELAAADFKEDISKKASEIANEYGPSALKFFDDFAIPLLRKTTATTVAGWNAVSEVTSEKSESEQKIEAQQKNARSNAKYQMSGVTLSEVVKEVSEIEGTEQSTGAPLEDFGRVVQRVYEASVNATRLIDGEELQEKSMQLRMKADETRAESMEVLEKLQSIKAERLRLTFQTSIDFSSTEAIQYLEGLVNDGVVSTNDEVTFMQRMTFKHPVQQDIESFRVAESEFDDRLQEKYNIDEEMLARQMALESAENFANQALQAEEDARRMLEQAQLQVTEAQQQMLMAQNTIRELDTSVRRVDQELTKADTILKRKRDVVRRELKRKSEKVNGPIFNQVNDGNVRLNPDYDKSMNQMGFEDQSIARIESLRTEEQDIESQFLKLVDQASRLVSRSEKLRIRSDELIGNEQTTEFDQNMMDEAEISDVNRRTV